MWGIDLRWLRELLQKSQVKQQIIWLDCCHAGEIIKLEDANPGNRGEDFRQCFIAATREYESAYEEITGNHGVLTAALLAGLEPSLYPTGKVDNLSRCKFIEQRLKGTTQKPVFTNFGAEPIILTATSEIGGQISQPPPGVCPYKGLQFFDFNDEDPKYFYGRSVLTDELLEKVRTGNFLAVLGCLVVANHRWCEPGYSTNWQKCQSYRAVSTGKFTHPSRRLKIIIRPLKIWRGYLSNPICQCWSVRRNYKMRES